MASSIQQFFAEFIGTFTLVFIGAGAVLVDSVFGTVGLLGIALAHGLALMSIIFAVGAVSGAHVNPAVTVSMWFTKNIESKKALGYIVFQLMGASLAGFLLLSIFGNTAHLGVTDLHESISVPAGILIEAVLTFFLVWTIFGVAVDKRGSKQNAGIAIGLVLAFDILFGGTLTGAAMNPARAFGPAIASGFWSTQIVYWIGPIAGALIAGFLYSKILLKNS